MCINFLVNIIKLKQLHTHRQIKHQITCRYMGYVLNDIMCITMYLYVIVTHTIIEYFTLYMYSMEE